MPMGTIDAITLAPRTLSAAEMQGRENTQNQHISDQNAVQFQQNNEQQARQTVESQKSETQEYDSEGGNGKGMRGGTRKKKEEKKEPKQKMAPRSNSSFDIMI